MNTRTSQFVNLIARRYTLTNRQLCQVFDVTERTISRWRSGKSDMPHYKSVAFSDITDKCMKDDMSLDELTKAMHDYLYRKRLEIQIRDMSSAEYAVLKSIVDHGPTMYWRGGCYKDAPRSDDLSDILVDWD